MQREKKLSKTLFVRWVIKRLIYTFDREIMFEH